LPVIALAPIVNVARAKRLKGWRIRCACRDVLSFWGVAACTKGFSLQDSQETARKCIVRLRRVVFVTPEITDMKG